MRFSSRIQYMTMLALTMGMTSGAMGGSTTNQRYTHQSAVRIAKGNCPEFFGPSCRNHKQTNQVRLKRRLKAQKSRNRK